MPAEICRQKLPDDDRHTEFAAGKGLTAQPRRPARIGINKQKAAPDYPERLENFSQGSTASAPPDYFFFAAFALRFSSIAACAAARRATGTRNGEQET